MYTVNYTNFFDFGVDAGDTQFERSFNQTSPFVTLSTPIRILGVPESTLRVRKSDMYAFTYMHGPFIFMIRINHCIIGSCKLQYSN